MGSFGFVKAGSERFPFEYDREVTPVGAGMSRFSTYRWCVSLIMTAFTEPSAVAPGPRFNSGAS